MVAQIDGSQMHSERPAASSAALRQRRLRRGMRSDLLEIKVELRELPDKFQPIIANCFSEQQAAQQQEQQR
jgi:hypothetical protein